MSTTNSNINLDNDPFPVFTPRSALQQQQLGRSPNTNNGSSSSLSQNSPYSARFNASAVNVNTNVNQNARQMISMVQNLSLNQPNLLQSQSPMMAKLQQSNNASGSSSSAASSSAHRKLFPNIDPTSSDLGMLSNGSGGANVHQQIQNLIQHQQAQLNSGGMDALSDQLLRTPPADLSHIVHLKRSDSYFISDELKNELLRKNMLSQSISTQELAIHLPVQVKDYHNLVPLDNQQINIDHKSRTFSYQTISYKATHVKTNCLYYLKRILGFRYVSHRCLEIVETWKKIHNANIIALRDVFGTKEFNGEHSIVFVYDYMPGLDTLQYRLYNNPNINLKGWSNPYNLDGVARPYSAGKALNGSRSLGLLPEQSVWEYVIQLTAIIRAIHTANLSCRIINPSRILVDHKSRIRLSGVGIFDVVDTENSISNVAQYQQDDLIEFGRLVLALACNSLIAIQKEHISTSVDIISRNYSADLRNLILHFMTPPSQLNGRAKSINDSMPIIGARFYTSLDNAYTRGDIIENELSKELENGRLFRLICKINILLDRQDGDWSETGDRYMLKLFRDYVFHQVTQNGQPWVDMAHMIQCLNKFDTGSVEKICLVSPDSQNIMIVSYAQLKKCFEKVFSETAMVMNS